ncbi:MAG: stage 0 sporulation family protein [Coriobacteriaceae bacterium]|nr:stage 0 sporulation family protein [Coriobacteriaceae bacterium]
MPKVAVVRLRYVNKDYWFSPAGIAIEEGDHVLVETARGREIGLVVDELREVADKDIQQPLKPVLRVATQADLDQADEMNRRGEEAMPVFRELIERHGLDMKPVRVEFMFAGDYATFYFAADDRVDFRNLVRDLAAQFKVRVDMRQIGVRDEARMLGGLGHCGEELCCARLGGEFQPVSIRMAKEQDLPLNPSKISGLCGRLMCCLRYEFEAYKDFKGRAPKKNAIIDTPAGLAKVVEFDTPREQLRLRMEDGSSLVVPLSSMDTGDKEPREGERLRPCHIGQEAFDQIIEDLHKDANLAMMGDKLFSSDDSLADKVAERGQLDRSEGARRKGRIAMGSEHVGAGSAAGDERRRRRRGGEGAEERKPEPPVRDQRRRRRSVTVGESAEPAAERAAAATSERKPRRRRSERPAAAESAQQRQQPAAKDDEQGKSAAPKPRRRRRGSRGSGNGAAQAAPKQGAEQASKPRPGQNSSTLHGQQAEGGQAAEKKPRRRRHRGGRGKGGSGSAPSAE